MLYMDLQSERREKISRINRRVRVIAVCWLALSLALFLLAVSSRHHPAPSPSYQSLSA